MPGDEKVGDDDVPVGVRGRQCAATVVEHEVNVGAVEQMVVPGAEVYPRRRGDLWHDLEDRGLRDAERRGRADRNARGQPDERDAPWIGMKNQRQQALSPLVRDRRAATERVVVVEAKLRIAAGVDDRDDSGRGLAHRAHDLFGVAQVSQRESHGIEPGERQQAGVTE